jgi:hypothetical protein
MRNHMKGQAVDAHAALLDPHGLLERLADEGRANPRG